MANSRLPKQDAAHAIKALKATGGNAAEAAHRLGVPVYTLKSRLDTAVSRFGFERPEASKIERVKLVEPATPTHLRKIAQLEQQVKGFRGELTAMTGEQVSQHALLEIIHGCVDGPAKPPSRREKQTKGHTTSVPILLASDWHWDEVVTPERVEHVNAYNRGIAVQRAKRCFRTFVDLTKNHLSKPSWSAPDFCTRSRESVQR